MKICAVSGKTFQSGNNVSHAENKTRRKFSANLQKKRLFSKLLGYCTMLVSSKGLKIIEAKGGLDAFLDQANKLHGNGEVLRRRFMKAKEKRKQIA